MVQCRDVVSVLKSMSQDVLLKGLGLISGKLGKSRSHLGLGC